MPYIHKAARAVVDSRIEGCIRTIRGADDVARNNVCRDVLRSIARHVHEHERPSVFDADDTNAVRLGKAITHEFVPDMREGVLNYVFSRIVAGSFIPHYPCRFRDWPYGKGIARVLKVFERTKLTLFSAGCNDLVLGALEGAKMEFYCRVAVPKERAARIDNGDIKEYIEPDVFP